MSRTGFLLPGVLPANRTRPSSAQKQRKSFSFDPNLERCELAGQSLGSPTGHGQGCFTGFPGAGRGPRSSWGGRDNAAHTPDPVLGAASLQRLPRYGPGISHQELWSEVLHVAPWERVKLDSAQRKVRHDFMTWI